MQEFGTRPDQTIYTDRFNTNTLTITGLVFSTLAPESVQLLKEQRVFKLIQLFKSTTPLFFFPHRIQYIQSINIRTFPPHRSEWKVGECNSVAVIVVEELFTTNHFCHLAVQIQLQQIPAARPHVWVGGRCQSGRKSSDHRKNLRGISLHKTLQVTNGKVTYKIQNSDS